MNSKTFIKKFAATLSGISLLALPIMPISASAGTVNIYDNFYSPQTLTVPVGSTVTWYNQGSMNHTVTSSAGMFNSGTMTPGSTFSVTFNGVGTYNYYCQFHQGMTGTVIVTPTGGGSGDTGTLTGTVTQPSSNIVVNSITPVRSSGVADNTFDHGWEWIFDVTVPLNEDDLAMKFSDWARINGPGTIPVANNMRFFSAQSSNAYNESTAIMIMASNAYSQDMHLTGNLGNSPQGTRRIHIYVQSKIPTGTPSGAYSTTFGIRTQ